MARVTFQFDDGAEYRIEYEEARAVCDELRAMGRDADQVLADRVREAASGDASEILHLSGARVEDDALAASLARALDHLRNLEPRSWEDATSRFSEDWRRLRDRMVTGYRPVTYDVVSSADAPKQFLSYTGRYDEGDRVVTMDGREWTAADVEHPRDSENGRMRLDPYRAP